MIHMSNRYFTTKKSITEMHICFLKGLESLYTLCTHVIFYKLPQLFLACRKLYEIFKTTSAGMWKHIFKFSRMIRQIDLCLKIPKSSERFLICDWQTCWLIITGQIRLKTCITWILQFNKGRFMCMGVQFRFYLSYHFRKFTGFWCWYCCIKRDKTDSIVFILMKF